MSARNLIAGALAPLLLAGCGLIPWEEWPGIQLCTNDGDCSSGQVCFVDGCGDPGQNMAVEVTPRDPASGPQDFTVDPEQLRAYVNLELFPPSKIAGTVIRNNDNYLERVTVTARGESTVLPGIHRRYGPVATTQTGGYVLPVGAGLFTLNFTPADPTLPPTALPNVYVAPGSSPPLDIVLPSDAALLTFSGKVLQTAAAGPVPAPLQVQVIDPSTKRPLSQRVAVLASGDFVVRSARPPSGSEVTLMVSPLEAGALVPQKLFTLSTQETALSTPLELGDFGAATTVTGRVVGPDGSPVVGAAVLLEGEVEGGGTFSTGIALTALDGTFQLTSLPAASGATMSVSVIPPGTARAALLVSDVPVTAGTAQLGDLACPERIRVTGRLVRPTDGLPAGGVLVVADPEAAVEGGPLPSDTFEARTDLDGYFELWLDPAIYRLDFFPGEGLPKLSRLARVDRQTAAGGPITLPDFSLSAGRTLRGTVTQRPEGAISGALPSAYATVRFFRRIEFEGEPGVLVLSQTVADAAGAYEVVLPTGVE